MNLNEWLCEGTLKISSALVELNMDKNIGCKVFNYTTRTKVIDILNRIRSLLFPGLFEDSPVNHTALDSVFQNRLKHISIDLCDLISGVLEKTDKKCDESVDEITIGILEGLPQIRRTLASDIKAAYDGDPAAKSYEEIILSYPSIEAVSIYRIAHLIHSFGVPIIPRIMTEYAHKNTGIDINPGAKIGERFFIDHGTGVVIGETCNIGSGVKLYQGVTLGAKSFPLDEHGIPIKNIKRHPDIGDNVVIYSGATILGGSTVVGEGSVIGGNVWLTESIPPYSTVFNAQPAPVIKNSSR